ncbi:MAG: hypothetical protein R2844_01055 [Caldilineales bacterium]
MGIAGIGIIVVLALCAIVVLSLLGGAATMAEIWRCRTSTSRSPRSSRCRRGL